MKKKTTSLSRGICTAECGGVAPPAQRNMWPPTQSPHPSATARADADPDGVAAHGAPPLHPPPIAGAIRHGSCSQASAPTVSMASDTIADPNARRAMPGTATTRRRGWALRSGWRVTAHRRWLGGGAKGTWD